MVKVASTHSGYGKIRVRNEDDMADVRSILILNKDFYSLLLYFASLFVQSLLDVLYRVI